MTTRTLSLPSLLREPVPGELRLSRLMFADRRSAPVWLVVRLLLGWGWFTAGLSKVTNEAWMSNGAPALKGFVAGVNAIWADRAQAHGHPNVAYGWYVDYMNWVGENAAVFGPVVAVSELLIGLGLLAGCLTGVAAMAGVSLNLMYVFGGSAGQNGTYLIAGVLLVLAWRVAGRIGADAVVLPALSRLRTGRGAAAVTVPAQPYPGVRAGNERVRVDA